MKKSIIFINQSSGYLMIDIINAHVPYYDNIILLTGFLNPRETRLHDKVNVKKCLPYKRSSSVNRFISWVGFWLQTLYFVFLKYRNHNVYLVSNPPLNIFTAKWLKRDFAFLVYDIYPEALAEYNYLNKKSKFYRFWKKSNYIAFSKAKRLFTISQGMKKAIIANGVKEKKIDIIPVWTNNHFFRDVFHYKNEFIKKVGINKEFIVGYSGNLGMSHPIEKITEIAKKLKHHKSIIFLIVGNGDKKELLIQKKKDMSLDNLKIIDFQPTYLFPQVLASFHIGVITLDAKASHLNVPSKTYNLMSAGKPILSIASQSSELSKIINTYGIGRNFSENQIEDMCNYILELKKNVHLYNQFKHSSKKASLEFSSENAKKMILN